MFLNAGVGNTKLDETWLDPIEKRLEEALKTALTARIPQPENSWTPEQGEQFWNSLHELLYRKYNPFNLDLPGNPKEDLSGR